MFKIEITLDVPAGAYFIINGIEQENTELMRLKRYYEDKIREKTCSEENSFACGVQFVGHFE